MSELTKKLHILKDGATTEETVSLYSTVDECAEPNLKFEVDGAAAYAKLGDVTDSNATSLRILRNSDNVTYAVLKAATVIVRNYWVRVDGAETDVEASEVETLSNTAFANRDDVAEVYFPSCRAIGDYAFDMCFSLTTISIPNATTIGDYAFWRCFSLTTIELPNATTIGDGAFYGCTALTSIELPNATTIWYDAFYYCTALTSIALPNATTIGDGAFLYCSQLTEIHFAAANQSVIESLSGYSGNFGADDATIYFDL